MKRWAYVALAASAAFGAEDLGTLTVEGGRSGDGFLETPDYLKQETFLDGAPAQKQLTVKEALAFPGVQGDPVKAVQTLAGVTTPNDGSGELFIHGSKPRETRTVINHLPIGYLFHLGGLHSVIAPEATAQIDAYLGGFDATYGNAMGAILDVTPNYPGGEAKGHLHMGIFDASFGVGGSVTESTALFIGGRRSYYDLLAPKAGELSDEADISYTLFPQYWDLNFMAVHTVGDSVFSLESIAAEDSLELDVQEAGEKDPLANGMVDSNYAFQTVGLRWLYDTGEGYSAHTLLSRMTTRNKTLLFDDYYYNTEFEEITLFHQSTFKLENHTIAAGTEMSRLRVPLDLYVGKPPEGDDYDYDFTSEEKFRIDTTLETDVLSLFLQDAWKRGDFTFRYGLRGGTSDYGDLGSWVDPRAAVVWQAGDNSFSFATGQYTQTPEGYKLVEELGNPDLGNEKSWHYVAGWSRTFEEAGFFKVEPFYKSFTSLAVDHETRQYENAGEGDGYGLDLTHEIRREKWKVKTAYTYLQSKRELEADGEKYRFFGEIPHTLEMLGSYDWGGGWILSGRLRFHSGSPYTPITGTYQETYTDTDGEEKTRTRPTYGEPFSARLPDYVNLGLKVAKTKKLASGNELEWSFELMNATNHDNVSNIKYDEEYNRDGYYYQLPLLPWFDVVYRF